MAPLKLKPPADFSRQGYLLNQKTAASATQCRSNPVSYRSLPKTGIFQISAGDYRRFRAKIVSIGCPETERQSAKGRNWRAFLGFMNVQSPVAALPGWRRSADRTRLQANSLLTGNFTGNFAISGLPRPISQQETAAPQSLFAQFPTQINRENISKNREFFAGIREFKNSGVSVHFSHTCLFKVQTRSVLTDEFER
jgi:hypothetical protein